MQTLARDYAGVRTSAAPPAASDVMEARPPHLPVASAPPQLARGWLAAAVALCLVALVLLQTLGGGMLLTDSFLVNQDLAVLMLEGAMLLLLLKLSAAAAPSKPTRAARWTAAAAALLVLVVGLVGWRLVFQRYPLSMDEFMASFDADSMRHGRLLSPVPAAWRSFVPALQPRFALAVPNHAVWASDYLPINAALQALARGVGVEGLAGALESALSVLLVFDVARRMWPARPDAAVAAALLLASSSQLLVMGMTAYAMPAHLMFNLLWLRLYQQERRWSDGLALTVGWAACGLHQLAFHLMFAAPFVLQAWTARRWRRAVVYTAGYGVIALFWVLYWSWVFRLLGLPPPSGAAAGPQAFAALVLKLAADIHPLLVLRVMAANLARFMSWQNPLMIALMIAGLGPALRGGGTLRALLGGLALTLAVVLVVMPYQGHGWGYRYLHGLLGSACLIAVGAYVELTGSVWRPEAARRALRLSVAGSLLVLLPWRAVQAHAFAAPYVRANAAIRADRAPFVIVDGRGLAFAEDLARNPPGFDASPLVFDLDGLSLAQVQRLCRRPVDVFDARDGLSFGIPALGRGDTRLDALRAQMAALDCGAVHVAALPTSGVRGR